MFFEVCGFLSGRTAELQQIDIEIDETPPHPHFCTGRFGNTYPCDLRASDADSKLTFPMAITSPTSIRQASLFNDFLISL